MRAISGIYCNRQILPTWILKRHGLIYFPTSTVGHLSWVSYTRGWEPSVGLATFIGEENKTLSVCPV